MQKEQAGTHGPPVSTPSRQSVHYVDRAHAASTVYAPCRWHPLHADTSPTIAAAATKTYRPVQHVQHHFKHSAGDTHRNPRTENAQAQCYGHATGRNSRNLGSPATSPHHRAPPAASPTAAPIRTGRGGHPPVARPMAAAAVHALAQPPSRNQRRRCSDGSDRAARHPSPPTGRR